MPTAPSLVRDIDKFMREHGLAASAFGRAAVNDWKFVRDLRNGRRVWPETEAKVRQFMDQYQPTQVAA